MAKLGPDNNFTAYICICICMYVCYRFGNKPNISINDYKSHVKNPKFSDDLPRWKINPKWMLVMNVKISKWHRFTD